MNKTKLPGAFICAALIALIALSGCTSDPTTVDESGYLGTYIGKHYLSDSTNLRIIVGNENMIYDDTLIVTNGSDPTDGKVSAQSTLLGSKSIELNVSNGSVTPVLLGDLTILSTTLKDAKVNNNSTATWDAAKANVSTHLLVSVTYVSGSSSIPLPPLTINGSFKKQ